MLFCSRMIFILSVPIRMRLVREMWSCVVKTVAHSTGGYLKIKIKQNIISEAFAFKHTVSFKTMRKDEIKPPPTTYLYVLFKNTLFNPFIDASSSAIFASSKAFPPSTASIWKPIGMVMIPNAVMPNSIIGKNWLRWRWRAVSIKKKKL